MESEFCFIAWRVKSSSGYCGPTVVDGRVDASDYVSGPEQTQRVHCMDWKTGRSIWTYAYPCDYGAFGFPAGRIRYGVRSARTRSAHPDDR